MNYTKFMEALKGKQHKIDKNKNGKVDAHDFKLLRKEETEELEEAVSVKKQDYSWGKMVTVQHGADTSYPLHPEHQAAIKKLNDGEKTSFKDETNRKVNAHREGDNVHLSSDRTGKKTTVAHSHFAEEANHAPVAPTLDRKYIKGTPENKALKASRKPINGMPTGKMKEEKTTGATKVVHTRTGADGAKYHIMQDSPSDYSIHREHNGKTKHIDTYGSLNRAKSVLDNEVKEEVELDEKLDPSMGAGEYIKDFQKSDAPQFAGKSKEKRRVMGIAAYLGAKRDVKEAVSPVSVKVNHALEEPHEEEWEDTGICPEHNKKDCHQCGKAGMKEQVEEIQEKSDQAKQNKTMKNLMAASKGAKLNRDSGLKLTPGDTGHSNAQQMNKALGRHAMRENEGQKSYKEFMMMLEYESDKSGSYTHKGSYGSEFAKKEREKDEKGFDSENEPAKRGPKMGSKRGPKANLGSSKLHTK